MADMTSPTSPVKIEECEEHHVEAIQAIYASYVRSSLATFETEPPTVAQMLSRRMDLVRAGYPYVVAMFHGRVVGYGYASSYRPRAAYRFTVENSVYVDAAHHGQGIGRRLLDALITQCARGGYRQMVAVIGDSGNAASIGLHKAMGFEHTGTLRDVGSKFGRWVDTVLMQRALTAGD
jgi:L-amino acid N-acyltransferase YncA